MLGTCAPICALKLAKRPTWANLTPAATSFVNGSAISAGCEVVRHAVARRETHFRGADVSDPKIELRVLDARIHEWGFPRYHTEMPVGSYYSPCFDEPMQIEPQAPAALIPSG